jgi:alkylhydroperoxidase family enzyme
VPGCASRSPPARSLSRIETRYDDLILRLREAAQPDRSAPPALRAYVEKVRLHAYEVTDAEVQDLKDTGPTEDEIFEHTVSAAVAAGLERLDAALAVLE